MRCCGTAALPYKKEIPGLGTSVGAEEIREEVGVGAGQVLSRFRFDYREKEEALWAEGSLDRCAKVGTRRQAG